MDNSQVNKKRREKEKENYESWSKENSIEFLQLMVDAVKRRFCDANESFSNLKMRYFST